jgi:hypothetical protein
MAGRLTCPRCGARDSFLVGYLPGTCLCRVCQSQLDYREIPDCGPACTFVDADAPEDTAGTADETGADGQNETLGA